MKDYTYHTNEELCDILLKVLEEDGTFRGNTLDHEMSVTNGLRLMSFRYSDNTDGNYRSGSINIVDGHIVLTDHDVFFWSQFLSHRDDLALYETKESHDSNGLTASVQEMMGKMMDVLSGIRLHKTGPDGSSIFTWYGFDGDPHWEVILDSMVKPLFPDDPDFSLEITREPREIPSFVHITCSDSPEIKLLVPHPSHSYEPTLHLDEISGTNETMSRLLRRFKVLQNLQFMLTRMGSQMTEKYLDLTSDTFTLPADD